MRKSSAIALKSGLWFVGELGCCAAPTLHNRDINNNMLTIVFIFVHPIFRLIQRVLRSAPGQFFGTRYCFLIRCIKMFAKRCMKTAGVRLSADERDIEIVKQVLRILGIRKSEPLIMRAILIIDVPNVYITCR